MTIYVRYVNYALLYTIMRYAFWETMKLDTLWKESSFFSLRLARIPFFSPTPFQNKGLLPSYSTSLPIKWTTTKDSGNANQKLLSLSFLTLEHNDNKKREEKRQETQRKKKANKKKKEKNRAERVDKIARRKKERGSRRIGKRRDNRRQKKDDRMQTNFCSFLDWLRQSGWTTTK